MTPQQTVQRQAYRIIREQIVQLKLLPGDAISEQEIAKLLGTSRTRVRESFILLAEEGLLDIQPQKGSFVARVDLYEVTEAQFVREMLECGSLEQSADRFDAADIAALREILSVQHRDEATHDVEAFFSHDETFHGHLMSVAGHDRAWRTANSAKAHLDRARRLSLPVPHQVATMIEQHTSIVDALEQGDATLAVARLRHHLREVFDAITRIREANPQFFADDSDVPASEWSLRR